MLISSQSRRELLQPQPLSSSPGPWEVEGGVCPGSAQQVMCSVPRGTQGICLETGACLKENLALWSCLIFFTQSCSPTSLLPFALLGLPPSPSLDVPGPAHLDGTDFLLPGLQAEGDLDTHSDPDAKAKGAPIPSSRDDPKSVHSQQLCFPSCG